MEDAIVGSIRQGSDGPTTHQGQAAFAEHRSSVRVNAFGSSADCSLGGRLANLVLAAAIFQV